MKKKYDFWVIFLCKTNLHHSAKDTGTDQPSQHLFIKIFLDICKPHCMSTRTIETKIESSKWILRNPYQTFERVLMEQISIWNWLMKDIEWAKLILPRVYTYVVEQQRFVNSKDFLRPKRASCGAWIHWEHLEACKHNSLTTPRKFFIFINEWKF